MPTHPTVTQLVALARADLAIVHSRKRIQTLKEKTNGLRAEGLAASRTVDQAKAHLVELKRTEIAAQQKLESYQTRRKTAIRALESGLGDPDAAERQLTQCGSIIDELEISILETFEAQDEAAIAIEFAKQKVQDQSTTRANFQIECERETPTLTDLIHTKQGLRRQLIDGLEITISKRYERLRRSKGTAVARVIDHCCRSCQLAMPMQDHSDLRRGLEVHCRKCGRWLFASETE